MTRMTKAHPKAGVTRGRRVQKKVATPPPVEKARGERNSGHKGETLPYYFHDIQGLGQLLEPREELIIGKQIKGIIGETVERLQALLEFDNPVLGTEPQPGKNTKAWAKLVIEVRSRQSEINPNALVGPELKAHLEEIVLGECGLDYIKRFGPPGGGRVVDRLIKANLRLVISLARKYCRTGSYGLEDTIQDGNFGLMIAALRYDYERGFRFSTYASWWIRHAILRGVADRGRLIRLPVHLVEFLFAIERCERYLTRTLGDKPSDEQIAQQHLAYQTQKKKKNQPPKPTESQVQDLVKKIKGARKQAYEPVSTSSRVNRGSDSDGQELEETLQSDEPEDNPWDGLQGEHLAKAMTGLSPIEEDVVRQCFGLDTDEEKTLKEIGTKYYLSRERIRQIRNHALYKLRLALAEHITV